MAFGNFEEFWAALGRLYEASVNNTTDIAELRRSIEATRESVEALRDSVAHSVDGINQLTKIVDEHEHRLDRHDVTIDAILEDLRRHREGPAAQ
jgi:hypothetical protein